MFVRTTRFTALKQNLSKNMFFFPSFFNILLNLDVQKKNIQEKNVQSYNQYCLIVKSFTKYINFDAI